jgi:hypothetical protein
MKKFLLERLPDRVWDNLATVSIIGLVIVLSLFAWKIKDLVDQNKHRIVENRALAQQMNESLCDLRGNSKRQVDLIRAILSAHPGKPSIFGIPRPVYQSSLANQQRTVDSLSNLNCQETG